MELCRQITCHGKQFHKKTIEDQRMSVENCGVLGQSSKTSILTSGLNPFSNFTERVGVPSHSAVPSIDHRSQQHMAHLGRSPLYEERISPTILPTTRTVDDMLPMRYPRAEVELLQNDRFLQLRNLEAAKVKRHELRNQQSSTFDEAPMRLQDSKIMGSSNLPHSHNAHGRFFHGKEQSPYVPPQCSSLFRDDMLSRQLLLDEQRKRLLQEIAVKKTRQSLLEENLIAQQLAARRSQEMVEKEVLLNGLCYGGSGSSNHSRIMNEAWNALVSTRSDVDRDQHF